MASPKFLKYLKRSCVIPELGASTKDEAIDELLSRLASENLLEDPEVMRRDIMDREAQMSTGLKDGLAIPHAKSDGARGLVVALGLKKDGVPFQSLDGQPARAIFLVVSKLDHVGPHLECLAEIAQIFNREGAADRLLEAGNAVDILRVLGSG